MRKLVMSTLIRDKNNFWLIIRRLALSPHPGKGTKQQLLSKADWPSNKNNFPEIYRISVLVTHSFSKFPTFSLLEIELSNTVPANVCSGINAYDFNFISIFTRIKGGSMAQWLGAGLVI